MEANFIFDWKKKSYSLLKSTKFGKLANDKYTKVEICGTLIIKERQLNLSFPALYNNYLRASM